MATDPYADAGARARQFFGSKAFQDAVSTVRSSAHHDLNTMLPMTLGAPDVMKSAAPAMTRFLEGLFGTTPQGGQAAPARAAVQAVAKAAPAQQQQAAQGPAGAPSDKNAYMQAIQDHQDRLERLARARAIDPTNPYYGGQ
jgi:hypothetical protein